jgi:hypothetical protein
MKIIKLRFISTFLIFFFFSANNFAQDTISTGKYKLNLPKSFNKEKKEKIQEECLEKAKLNAIENAFGVYIENTANHTISSVRKNDVEDTNASFNSSINSLVTGKWVKEIEPATYTYDESDGLKWLTVTVKGYVRETKPKSFNEDKEAMAKYMKELYLSYPFNDVTLVENYENKYLISVVDLYISNYKSNTDMNRVAQIKARAQVNRYINGTNTEDIFIIKSTDLLDNKNTGITETLSIIKESAFGWVNSVDLLTVFPDKTGLKSVFIYSKKIERDPK